jgi:acyl-CoA synthetase (NDP forming)
VIHKARAGAIELDLHGDRDVRQAYARLARRFGERLQGVLVQPMAAGGVELLLGAVQDPVFGPLVVFGLGGTATDALDDRAARLAPLTDADAADLIHSVRAAPLLLGGHGEGAVDLAGLHDTILRLSTLADDLPEIAELDLNPIIARPDGVIAVDARIRVTPAHARTPTCGGSDERARGGDTWNRPRGTIPWCVRPSPHRRCTTPDRGASSVITIGPSCTPTLSGRCGTGRVTSGQPQSLSVGHVLGVGDV